MKVCHVTSAHNRYDVRIFEKECSSLAANQYTVFLIVNDNYEDEIKNNVKIISTKYTASNRFQRMFVSMKYILKKAEEIDADVYHLHDPELLGIVRKLKKGKRKIIFDAHEDTEVQIMDKDWIPRGIRWIISKAYIWYAGRVLKKCNGIITVTPAIVKKMERYNNNVEMVTNYPVISGIVPTHFDSKEKYVFFAGGVSPQWCHERIISAVSKLQDIRYKMAGSVEKEYYEGLKQCAGWDKVDYLGKIPHSEVEAFYNGAIAGMAVNECSQLKGEGTLGNTKLFEVMAASKPVICTDYKLWKEIVDYNKCGICVGSDDVQGIADAIRYLAENYEQAKEMGKRGRMAVEKEYNWRHEERKLLNMYEKL